MASRSADSSNPEPKATDGHGLRVVHVAAVPQTVQRLLADLIAYQVNHGFRVSAVCSAETWIRARSVAEDLGIPVHCVPIERRFSPFKDVFAIIKLWFHFIRLQPEIVHSHTPKGGLIGGLAALLSRRPVRIYHIRGAPYLTASGFSRILLLAAEWASCRCAHRVITVSHSLRDDVVYRNLVSRERITVIASGSSKGVDALHRFNPRRLDPSIRSQVRQRFEFSESEVVLGFVGRLVRDKGIIELATLWERLSPQLAQLRLLLVGPKEEPRDLVDPLLVRRLLDSPGVHHAGNQSEIEVFFAAMDILVFPSWREGFPNVPLEAAAMEIPVVTFNAVGSRDAVIHGKTGFVTPIGDDTYLADSVVTLVNSPELRHDFGSAGRRRVLSDFQPEPIFRAIVKLYLEHLVSMS